MATKFPEKMRMLERSISMPPTILSSTHSSAVTVELTVKDQAAATDQTHK